MAESNAMTVQDFVELGLQRKAEAEAVSGIIAALRNAGDVALEGFKGHMGLETARKIFEAAMASAESNALRELHSRFRFGAH